MTGRVDEDTLIVDMTMRFLAIGECMAELSPMGGEGAFRLGFAGDTFNTAWYLARIGPGADIFYYTAVGDDTISRELCAAIRSAGINDDFVQILDGATVGLYLISLDRGERSFSYWRGQSAARQMVRDSDMLTRALDACDLIYFSGITLAILDAAQRTTLLTALRGARAAGKTVAFDPNLRPRLWESPDAMRNTILQGAAVSNVLLPSFEDEADWFRDNGPEATVRRYLDAGAETVVVKNGAGPVHYVHDGNAGAVPVEPLRAVVDTTAAGDSFNAEILFGLATGAPIAPCIERACNLAASVVQGRGALVRVDPGRTNQ